MNLFVEKYRASCVNKWNLTTRNKQITNKFYRTYKFVGISDGFTVGKILKKIDI